MSLAEHVKAVTDEHRQATLAAIGELVTISADLGLAHTSGQLAQYRDLLDSDTFHIVISGQFNNGKSTLLNALLGQTTLADIQLDPTRGPIPTDPFPCTAVLTCIKYAETPSVICYRRDGSAEPWTLGRFLAEGTIRDDQEETRAFFDSIDFFEVGYPIELCRAGVTIWDSPGLNDKPERNETTRKAMERCDVTVAIYRSDVFGGLAQEEFLRDTALSAQVKPLFVINLWNGDQPAGRLLPVVWNRIVKDLLGRRRYDGDAPDSFAAQDVFFVQARQAEAGRWSGDAALVRDSGLEQLEGRLAQVLSRERFAIHIQRFVGGAELESRAVPRTIADRQAAMSATVAELQRKYEELQPQLNDIAIKEALLPNLFEVHRLATQRKLRDSYQHMITRSRPALRDALRAWTPPSADNWHAMLTQVFRAKPIADEINTFCKDFVNDKANRWAATEAQAVIQDEFALLDAEIKRELDLIDQHFAEIEMVLLGQTQVSGSIGVAGMPQVSTWERVGATLVGLVAGGPVAALSGSVGGWRSVAGSTLGAAAAGVVLAVFTGPLSVPVALILIAAGGTVGASKGLSNTIKTNVLEGTKKYRGMDALLAGLPEQMGPTLDTWVDETFAKRQEAMLEQIGALLDERRRKIQRDVDSNRDDEQAKIAARRLLDLQAQRVEHTRRVLLDTLTRLDQVRPETLAAPIPAGV